MLPLRRQLNGVICQGCRNRLLKQLPVAVPRTWRRSYASHDHLRGRSSLPIDDPASWNTVRNIGIIAHIDAVSFIGSSYNSIGKGERVLGANNRVLGQNHNDRANALLQRHNKRYWRYIIISAVNFGLNVFYVVEKER